MDNLSIAIIGLGYVGLPLAIAFSGKYKVKGFDTDPQRIADLICFKDTKGIADSQVLEEALEATGAQGGGLFFTTDIEMIRDAGIYIITVPTPVDQDKKPDLEPLLHATKMIGSLLKKGDLVIYESTVYPGCTEEECVPVLEKFSGLNYNEDFFCGYSPERINVGDAVNTLNSIVKVTSGSTPEIAEKVDLLYASIIKAGTYAAPSIKVAEASKAIENAQRDLNISFVNELALIFDRMGIDTHDVLAAAATKWNFLNYKPGLVGGHCIGVDPYYLTYKAERLGYHPKVILSGRNVNEGMGKFVADKVMALVEAKDDGSHDAMKVLILGITFKENCTDIRNSGVLGLYESLKEHGAEVEIYDPWADPIEVSKEYFLPLLPEINYIKKYNVVILAVAHSVFENIIFENFKKNGALIYDIKGVLDRTLVDSRL